MRAPWHVCVVVPARDEERLLGRCLRSIRVAQGRLPVGVTTDLVVVVDRSTDGTWEIAQRAVGGGEGAVLAIHAGAVGVARAQGTAEALARRPGAAERCWIASTDADCEVPEAWLEEQLAIAETGIEGVAGTIDVDSFEEHHAVVRQRFHESYLIHADGTHPHVHGANLGIRGDAYLRVGGWGTLATAEDHDLWGRLRAAGATLEASNRIRVLTSGRRQGRAPQGFAQALERHNEAAP